MIYKPAYSVCTRNTKPSLLRTALASSGRTKKIGRRISWYGPSNPVSKSLLFFKMKGQITRKEVQAYFKVKEVIEKCNYKESDLRKMLETPKITLRIYSDDMEPTEYDSLRSASEDIGVSYQTFLYAYGKGITT